MGRLEKVGKAIDWGRRGATVWAFAKVYVPLLVPVLAVIAGVLEKQAVMWIIMAAALGFGGVALGILAFSAYRERKNPAHKIIYVETRFTCDLVPAAAPTLIHGNRGARRAVSKEKIEPRILGGNEVSPHVTRKLQKGQLGVLVKNRAHFPISVLVFSASTKLDDFTPPRSNYPKKAKLLGPGEAVLFNDDAIDMDETPCGPIAGEMDILIKYGLPGDERHDLRLHGNVNVQMEHFGFVSAVQTGWLM